jgi:N-acetylglucosamine-6-phosphate deacetylase
MILSGCSIVTPSGVLAPGWVRLGKSRIETVGRGEFVASIPGERIVALPGRWVLPGLVDIHNHGGGGASFASHDPQEVLSAVAFHRRHGTTRLWASLVSAPLDELARSVALLAELVDQGEISGIHLEGPFLSRSRCGAQNPDFLLVPDREAMANLLRAARGTIRMVTIAPELTGALALIRQVADAGAVPAVGHTDATYDQALAAVDAGAQVATHLFNGMRPPHHREPGPSLAVLEREEVVCEIIADGAHLHPAVVRHVTARAGPNRVALVTDATLAAGLPDGTYRLGALAIRVKGGVAHLAEGDSLAGSTLTAAAGLSWTVQRAGLRIDDAVSMAATTPARVAGLEKRCGKVEVGMDADIVVCDHEFHVERVMVAGKWVEAA